MEFEIAKVLLLYQYQRNSLSPLRSQVKRIVSWVSCNYSYKRHFHQPWGEKTTYRWFLVNIDDGNDEETLALLHRGGRSVRYQYRDSYDLMEGDGHWNVLIEVAVELIVILLRLQML